MEFQLASLSAFRCTLFGFICCFFACGHPGAAFVEENRTQSRFPEWDSTDAKERIWSLAYERAWDDLYKLVEPVIIGLLDKDKSGKGKGFFAIDQETHNHLEMVRKDIDGSSDAFGCGVVYWLLREAGDETSEILLKSILALGADPDQPNDWVWRPAHLSSALNKPKSARALSLCRPSLTAKNAHGRTPLEEAKSRNHTEVAKIWEDAQKFGFKILPQLAHDQEWFAVKNLVRRNLVERDEAEQTFQGKTAVEWARLNGRNGLAREMEYLLGLNDPESKQDQLQGRRETDSNQEKEIGLQAQVEESPSPAADEVIRLKVFKILDSSSQEDSDAFNATAGRFELKLKNDGAVDKSHLNADGPTLDVIKGQIKSLAAAFSEMKEELALEEKKRQTTLDGLRESHDSIMDMLEKIGDKVELSCGKKSTGA